MCVRARAAPPYPAVHMVVQGARTNVLLSRGNNERERISIQVSFKRKLDQLLIRLADQFLGACLSPLPPSPPRGIHGRVDPCIVPASRLSRKSALDPISEIACARVRGSLSASSFPPPSQAGKHPLGRRMHFDWKLHRAVAPPRPTDLDIPVRVIGRRSLVKPRAGG